MNDFWKKFRGTGGLTSRAIWALAPMAGLTDSAFRQVCSEYGADVVYSEMASVAALYYQPAKTLELLASTKKENNYVVQLFGSNPEHFAKAVKILTEKITLPSAKGYGGASRPSGRPSLPTGVTSPKALADGAQAGLLRRGLNASRHTLNESPVCNTQINAHLAIPNSKFLIPSGLDLNFGCPVKKVQKQGAGAVLMDKPKLARDIVKAVLDSTDLPLSIKIRTQVSKTDALRFLYELSDLNISAVMIHGRTMSQGHSGPVNWEIIKKARDYFGGIILANGGAMDATSARELLQRTEADGVGIARGALGQPWIFSQVKNGKRKVESKEEIFNVVLRHAELAFALKGERGIVEMRPHLCAYVTGLQNAREIRQELVRAKTVEYIKETFKKFE